MKPRWIIWWWLFDWEMFSIVLGICMLGPQLVALLVWCSLIGGRTSEGQTLSCKSISTCSSLSASCLQWGCDISLCFCYTPSSLCKLILVLVFYLSNRKAMDPMILLLLCSHFHQAETSLTGRRPTRPKKPMKLAWLKKTSRKWQDPRVCPHNAI